MLTTMRSLLHLNDPKSKPTNRQTQPYYESSKPSDCDQRLNMRLDAYLAQYWPETSRSAWQKHIIAGYVLVNGVVETTGKRTLSEDDEVTFKVPDAPTFEDQTLPVI